MKSIAPNVEIRITVRNASNGAVSGRVKKVSLSSLSQSSHETVLKLASDYYFYGLAPPGLYRSQVTLMDEKVVSVNLNVPNKGRAFTLYVSDADSTVRTGTLLPKNMAASNVVGIVINPAPSENLAARVQQSIDSDEGLRDLAITAKGISSEQQAGQSAALVYQWAQAREDKSDHRVVAETLLRAISRAVGSEAQASVGIAVEAGDSVVVNANNEFIVRAMELGEGGIAKVQAQAGWQFLRRLRHAKNAFLVKIADAQFEEQSLMLEHLRRGGQIQYWEPNYLERAIPHSAFADLSQLPHYKANRNYLLESIPDAWKLLDSNNIKGRDVRIATVDTGIDPDNEAIKPSLMFGFDFDMNRPFLSSEMIQQEITHGMCVYGIVSAIPTSNFKVAGIAPNCAHVALRCLNGNLVRFSEILLWLSGVEKDAPDDSEFERFLGSLSPEKRASLNLQSQPVHVISLSQGRETPIPETLSDTLDRLLNEGRDGKGTVIVCSAGNENKKTISWLAEDPRVITVTNTEVDQQGEEIRHNSKHGYAVDICAQAEGCPSLGGNPNLTHVNFGGTSAAAPMVAAVAALMLSANSELTAVQVRDILRSTAKRVDHQCAGHAEGSRQRIGAWIPDPFAGMWRDYSDPASVEPRQFSQYYGFGRLDAVAAVRKALDLKQLKN